MIEKLPDEVEEVEGKSEGEATPAPMDVDGTPPADGADAKPDGGEAAKSAAPEVDAAPKVTAPAKKDEAPPKKKTKLTKKVQV